MQDTRPPRIKEAIELTKRDMDLERDLDNLEYNYRHAKSQILNEQSKIALRIGELRRIEGFEPIQRSKTWRA